MKKLPGLKFDEPKREDGCLSCPGAPPPPLFIEVPRRVPNQAWNPSHYQVMPRLEFVISNWKCPVFLQQIKVPRVKKLKERISFSAAVATVFTRLSLRTLQCDVRTTSKYVQIVEVVRNQWQD